MNDPNNPYGGQQQPGAGWGQQPQQPQQPQWGQQQPHQQQQQQQQPQWNQQQQQGQQQQQAQPQWGLTPQQQQQREQQEQYDEDSDEIASEASPAARAKFIERTYTHLAGAIMVFVLLSTAVQWFVPVDELLAVVFQMQYGWIMVLVLFMAVSWVADSWASRSTSKAMQYAGLGLYTLAEVAIFVPMIFIARLQIGSEGITTAAVTTMATFAGLTGYVFITKKDFSFLRGILSVLAVGALVLIGASLMWGFRLELAFSIGMVVLAAGYILYYTSNVLHHYRCNQHVGAALALFSAVALLFWYILRIFMRR